MNGFMGVGIKSIICLNVIVILFYILLQIKIIDKMHPLLSMTIHLNREKDRTECVLHKGNFAMIIFHNKQHDYGEN